jgi:predicted nuclease of predicted toxin-antitoxin system
MFLHTLDLPDTNRTSDARINELSVAEQHIVVTKDADFVNSFFNIPSTLQIIAGFNG